MSDTDTHVVDQAALSGNSVLRASSENTKRVKVVHKSDRGVGILSTPAIDREQAIAGCRKEFPDDEVIGVPECPDCGLSTHLRYYWGRELWFCRSCERSVDAESPEQLPQDLV